MIEKTRNIAFPFKDILQLLKLRIGTTISLTAIIGYLAVANHINGLHLAILALIMLMGSMSASIFNHFYDRDIDQLMERTASRPLAASTVQKPGRVLWLSAFFLASGVLLAITIFNWVVALHLLLGAFLYTIVYTVWLKRRTWLNIIIGGGAGSFAILAGAAAVDPLVWLLPWLLALTLFLWTPSHFWALALLMKEDYIKAHVPMLPCLVSETKTAQYILINSLLLVGSSLLPWILGELGHWYGIGVLVVGGWFLWLNKQLVREPTPLAARATFLGSMQYLFGIFVSVLIDKHLYTLGAAS